MNEIESSSSLFQPEAQPEVQPEVQPRPASAASPIGPGVMNNVVIPLALLVAGAAVVWLLGSVEPEKRADPDTTLVGRLRSLPPVRVAQLQSLDSIGQRLELEVDGVVVPFQEARVAAEVDGRVVYKDPTCEAGSYVTANQLLMKIDDTDYQLDLERLTRQVEQEAQAIKESDQELTNTKRLIDVASQDLSLQQKEVDRLVALRAQGAFASQDEVDRAKRGLLASTQQLVTVENQYDLLNQRRIRLQASLKLAETQLRAAELNVERTNIRAPIEGVIVSEESDLNTFVARGTPLVTIENTTKVEVASSLRMDQLYWVLDQAGEKLDATARGYVLPDTPVLVEFVMSGRDDVVYRWNGRLLSYDGIGLDPETRTVPVRVVVDEPRRNVDEDGNSLEMKSAPALLRGMYVRVRLLLRPQTPLVVIPAEAMQPGNRVLQFMPDESVLQVQPTENSAAVTPPGDAGSADAGALTKQVDDRGEFDPLRWEPGRVVVRKSIHPVDSLRLATKVSDGDRRGSARKQTFWVCEVGDDALPAGSFVIVSAMGDVDAQAPTAVRADRDGISEFRDNPRAMTPAPQPSNAPDSVSSREDV
jgi:multidrug efflux pump subunit AcrA (membrane-fusion protein)